MIELLINHSARPSRGQSTPAKVFIPVQKIARFSAKVFCIKLWIDSTKKPAADNNTWCWDNNGLDCSVVVATAQPAATQIQCGGGKWSGGRTERRERRVWQELTYFKCAVIPPLWHVALLLEEVPACRIFASLPKSGGWISYMRDTLSFLTQYFNCTRQGKNKYIATYFI